MKGACGASYGLLEVCLEVDVPEKEKPLIIADTDTVRLYSTVWITSSFLLFAWKRHESIYLIE